MSELWIQIRGCCLETRKDLGKPFTPADRVRFPGVMKCRNCGTEVPSTKYFFDTDGTSLVLWLIPVEWCRLVPPLDESPESQDAEVPSPTLARV